MLQRWPFCWWVLVILDHFSRAAVGFAVFTSQPTAEQVCAALDLAVRRAGRAPKYTVTDQGAQFAGELRGWCARNGVKPRFGAVGRYGSIAVIERAIRTIKEEGLRRILVPMNLAAMRSELVRLFEWYNLARPHMHLSGAAPAEALHGRTPANRRPRLEPRARYPAGGACAAPPVRARAVGFRLTLVVSGFDGAKHLPVVRLKQAA
jgi:transposase InsO family protein